MFRSLRINRRVWQLFAAALLVLGTYLATPRQQAFAMPPCDSGIGEQCQMTEGCLAFPFTDVQACIRRFYYYDLSEYFL